MVFSSPCVSPKSHFDIQTNNEQGKSFTAHAHQDLEILYFHAGSGTHQIGTHTFLLQPGSLYFIAPQTLHCLQAHQGSQFFIITFDLKFLPPTSSVAADHDPYRLPLLAPFALQKQLQFHLKPELALQIEQLCLTLLQEKNNHCPCAQDIQRALLTILIGHAFRSHAEVIQNLMPQTVPTARKKEVLVRTLRLIDEGFHQKLSLEEAAGQLYLSSCHLAHLLKRETGKTFVDLLTEKRLEKSSQLLLHTELSINEIASRVGFEDAAYFTKRFRQKVGLSPKAYRAHHTDNRPSQIGER
ncbi:MAG: helix-turn-helix transcriptional regulator [Anaerolineae bacterium]|nr:helix-turn-helix transcriptional regulator [Gloeobacterales cyanobacterium ES-bin-313]